MKVIDSESIYKGKVFEVRRERMVLPNAREAERAVVRHPGAALIVPQFPNGDFLLVNQYRYAPDCTLLEFPAGTLEAGEEPLACARREIIEEVAHEAKEWISLGSIYPAPGFCDELQHCYLARDLIPKPGTLDEDEILEVRRLSAAQFRNEVHKGNVRDGKTLAVYTLLSLRGLA